MTKLGVNGLTPDKMQVVEKVWAGVVNYNPRLANFTQGFLAEEIKKFENKEDFLIWRMTQM
jgi:hypothetical protein